MDGFKTNLSAERQGGFCLQWREENCKIAF